MSEASSEAIVPGIVYTFYSYKGGVGRSMALVNVGVVMALAGKRVLLVDWDLEAPGLEAYFRNAAKLSGDPRAVPGVVDLLEARASGKSLSWKDCRLRADFFGSSLDIISAGRRSPDYRSRVQKLDWDTLYSEHKVGNFVNELREEWRSTYDFILIDSRTGITDVGDICTVLLPDVLVLMFITNYQNIEGVKSVIERAEAARKKLPVNRSKLLGVPVPARDEVFNENKKSQEWRGIFAGALGHLYKEWLPKEVAPADALNKLFIPYVTYWSFGECIPVLEDARELQDPTTIGAAYARLANLLSSGLDWYAIEGRASIEELQGTRVELQRAREDALQLEQRARTLARERRRSLALAVIAALVGLLSAAYLYYEKPSESYPIAALPPPSTELYVGDDLLREGKTDQALAVFQARKAAIQSRLYTRLDDNELLYDLHVTLDRIGDIFERQGKLTEALASFEESKRTRERILAKTPNDSRSHRDLAVSYIRIGRIFEAQGKLDQALVAFQSYKAIMDKLTAQDPSNTDWQRDLAVSHSYIGGILEVQGKLDQALAAFQADKAIMDKLTTQDPSNTDWQHLLAVSYRDIGRILKAQGKLDQALAAFQSSKVIMDKLTAQDPSNTDWQRDLAVSHNRIGGTLEAQGKLDQALAAFQADKAIMDKLTAQDPSNTDWQRELAVSHNRIGDILQAHAELDQALAAFQSSKAIMDNLTAQDPSNTGWQRDLATTSKRLGGVLLAQAKTGDALAQFASAEKILDRLTAATRSHALWKRELMEVSRRASEAQLVKGDGTAALSAIEKSLQVYRTAEIEKGSEIFWNHELAMSHAQLAEVVSLQGDFGAALKALNTAQGLLTGLVSASPSNAQWRRDLERVAEKIAARNDQIHRQSR